METDHPHDAETIPEWIEALAMAYGDTCCVTSDAGARTFRGLDDASRRLARGLLARSVGKGSRVGILFGNGSEWVTWWAAISRIGAICIPISTFLQPAELARVVRHADLQLLVATRHFLDRDFEQVISEALPSLGAAIGPDLVLPEAPFLRGVVLDDSIAAWARSPTWIEDGGSDDEWSEVLAAAQREVFADDDALCIYTSGQSADPKGVMHAQSTVVQKAHYFRQMFGFDSATQTGVTMPFFWVGGLVMALFPTMDAGGTTHCTDRSTWGTGTVIGNTTSAAPSASAMTAYSSFRMLPALGMTETFGMYSWGHEPPVEEYPIAAPLDELQPGFELKLVDADGSEVPDGVPGEILVRGPTLATRLQKVARVDAFDPDGYYRTGDRGIRVGTRVHFVGRAGDMIKTSGANVSPAEVEREIYAIDGVIAAHVVAIDDVQRDQVVAAAVVLTPGLALMPDAICAHLRTRLSTYKVPKMLVVLDSVDEVPMTPSLKVRKRELATLIAARHAASAAAEDVERTPD